MFCQNGKLDTDVRILAAAFIYSQCKYPSALQNCCNKKDFEILKEDYFTLISVSMTITNLLIIIAIGR